MTEERVRRRSRSAPTPRQSRAKATIPFDTAERRQRPARSADREPPAPTMAIAATPPWMLAARAREVAGCYTEVPTVGAWRGSGASGR